MDDLLDNAPCGFLSFTDDGTILDVNATLLALLGHEAGALQNQPLATVLSVGSRVFFQTHFFPLLKLSGTAEEIYLTLRTQSGQDLPVLANAKRREREGRTVNDCVFVPMRQRSRFEDELVQAKKAAEEATEEAARAHVRERTIAEQLQGALQPQLPPSVPGLALTNHFEPALKLSEGVGGDFFDVFALDKGRTALVVGDLSGKGLTAAAHVATVRNMLRAFLYTQPTLAEAVTELNQVLAENNLLTGFTTLFVGAYDAASRTLRYVSCGQEPALARRVNSNGVEELMPTGPILGAFIGAQYVESSLTLSPGDALAIFTDGLTESGSTRATMLGIEGVSALFGQPIYLEESEGAQELAERLKSRLIVGLDAAAQSGIRDDVCLLVAVVES